MHALLVRHTQQLYCIPTKASKLHEYETAAGITKTLLQNKQIETMGLDILIITDNNDKVRSIDFYDEKNDYSNKFGLSRTFCNFMCRQHVVDHEAELDQIGKIANIDISPIYEMEQYPEQEGMEFFLEQAESEGERQSILDKAAADKEKLKGNIDIVKQTIDNLIEKLSFISNLPDLLLDTKFDTLNNQKYFSDFQKDKEQNFVENNFGQDLRNFRRFLEYAKSKGATTVWFNYG